VIFENKYVCVLETTRRSDSPERKENFVIFLRKREDGPGRVLPKVPQGEAADSRCKAQVAACLGIFLCHIASSP